MEPSFNIVNIIYLYKTEEISVIQHSSHTTVIHSGRLTAVLGQVPDMSIDNVSECHAAVEYRKLWQVAIKHFTHKTRVYALT